MDGCDVYAKKYYNCPNTNQVPIAVRLAASAKGQPAPIYDMGWPIVDRETGQVSSFMFIEDVASDINLNLDVFRSSANKKKNILVNLKEVELDALFELGKDWADCLYLASLQDKAYVNLHNNAGAIETIVREARAERAAGTGLSQHDNGGHGKKIVYLLPENTAKDPHPWF